MKSLATICVLGFFCAGAGAATYYVDPSGANGNDGLSPQTPWRTLLKVGISTFQPGDVILFKRDGVWNEWLTPPSSGTTGNLIKFDAYGNGRPPELTGRYTTTDSQWTNTSGSVWQNTPIGSGGANVSKTVYLNKAAFINPAQFAAGNIPRTAPYGLRVPYNKDLDLSLRREIPIREQMRLMFQADVFNVPNEHHFAAPGTNIDNASFGVFSSQANAPRKLQLGARFIF